MDPRVIASIKATMLQLGIDQIRAEKAGDLSAAARFNTAAQAMCGAYPALHDETAAGLLSSVRGGTSVH